MTAKILKKSLTSSPDEYTSANGGTEFSGTFESHRNRLFPKAAAKSASDRRT